jgi:hypothetical protein
MNLDIAIRMDPPREADHAKDVVRVREGTDTVRDLENERADGAVLGAPAKLNCIRQ